MNKLTLLALLGFSLAIVGCDYQPNSDQIQRQQQEKILSEGTSSVGMPAIKNFREKKLLKDILELRDQEGLTTYVYIVAEQTGKLIFLGYGVGYGIPYATQYTSPMRPARYSETSERGNISLPQADPNGLFSPASADGTWVLMKDPNGTSVKPVYIEPRCIVSPFPLQ